MNSDRRTLNKIIYTIRIQSASFCLLDKVEFVKLTYFLPVLLVCQFQILYLIKKIINVFHRHVL